MGVDKPREKQVIDISFIPNEARELQGSCIRTAKSAVMLQQRFPKTLIETGNTLDSSDLKGCSSLYLFSGNDHNKGDMKTTTKQFCGCFKDDFELC